MKTETSNVKSSNSTASLSTNAVFDILLEEQRRDALSYLSQKVGAVSVDELVEGIAHRNGDLTPERLEAISTRFHHAHLPKLIDSAVVRYDPATGTIERRDAARILDPYLELASLEDGRQPRSA
ncbi:DUF7344 domain-containing protein [Natronorubrum texcoconense]|uniref:DUF7344 domain-containing protein n=1 Tax=Natronorubrum texcoconense TaxID=1095776 RepID=A0A1G8SUY1_9EURY|nr:hypothetical protein [Natronorubrum texcoconense]SDJ33057.1 hypothetical protein SAMN04515672_0209 [Natronorubrum texcoconense]